eukprot:14714485-Alexandrium_andersonii.AAC.1
MSASLVGSEMCIRDRPKREPNGKQTFEHSPECCGDLVPTGDDVSPDSVSYTHLTLPTICSV